MGDHSDSPGILSADLDVLVVPETPEYIWGSPSAIDESVVAETLAETLVHSNQLESFIPVDVWPSQSAIDYLDCGCPYYGPPPKAPLYNRVPPPASYGPPATPSYGPPATPSYGTPATPSDPAQAPPVVYSDFERQMLAILLPGYLDLI